MRAASAAPSMSRAPVALALRVAFSASKVDRPRFPNEHNLDLPRVLELGFDATSDLLGERGHADVVHVIRNDDDTNLTPGLDGEHLLHSLVAGGDALQPLEA